MRKSRGRIIPDHYSELCDMWDDYYKKHGKYPNSVTCQNDFNLPAWSKVKVICGDRFNDFCDKYNIKKTWDVDKYNYYCSLIVELSLKLNKTPSTVDIRKYSKDIPDWRWLIKHCPFENVNNFNDLMSAIGLKPNYNVTKEMATHLIIKKKNQLNKDLTVDDFKNPKPNEIGIWTIERIWGSFNNMIDELKIQKVRTPKKSLQKPIDELKSDIVSLCNEIYLTHNRRVISVDDIENCSYCQKWGTYQRRFKKELGITLTEFIHSIGFETNESGTGYVHIFEDGEKTTSKYEYMFSSYLKEKNIKYIRNVKYKEFVDGYEKNKDCDYVIQLGNDIIYVELAGMLRDVKSIEHAKSLSLHKIHKKYLKNLIEKENMLKQEKLNYMILFPCHLDDMDFLFTPKNIA